MNRSAALRNTMIWSQHGRKSPIPRSLSLSLTALRTDANLSGPLQQTSGGRHASQAESQPRSAKGAKAEKTDDNMLYREFEPRTRIV
jgi:hypothetical protein